MRQRCQGHAQLAGQLGQFDPLGAALGNGAGGTLDTRQRQQLVGQVSEAVGTLRRLLQGAVPQRWFALAQTQFDARLERRQRRAQLVGGVGDELRLAFELLAQTLGEVVERGHQRAQLVLYLDHR